LGGFIQLILLFLIFIIVFVRAVDKPVNLGHKRVGLLVLICRGCRGRGSGLRSRKKRRQVLGRFRHLP
jgi:hypothetical protein